MSYYVNGDKISIEDLQIDSFSQDTGMDKNFLILLRREIESYFPKPFPLTSFNWLPQDEIKKLDKKGIKNTDPEVLCNALTKINEGNQYFKGNIGLRDIKRLIHSANYLTR